MMSHLRGCLSPVLALCHPCNQCCNTSGTALGWILSWPVVGSLAHCLCHHQSFASAPATASTAWQQSSEDVSPEQALVPTTAHMLLCLQPGTATDRLQGADELAKQLEFWLSFSWNIKSTGLTALALANLVTVCVHDVCDVDRDNLR